MTSFVHKEYALEHSGVVRAEQAAKAISHAVHNFNGARATASMLLAAVVAALMVAANQFIETWTDGHLLAGWVALWAVAFAAMALLATPTKNATHSLRMGAKAWSERRRQAAADDKLWGVALYDARVMADISRAMDSDAERERGTFFNKAAVMHMGR